MREKDREREGKKRGRGREWGSFLQNEDVSKEKLVITVKGWKFYVKKTIFTFLKSDKSFVDS